MSIILTILADSKHLPFQLLGIISSRYGVRRADIVETHLILIIVEDTVRTQLELLMLLRMHLIT